MGNPKTFLRLEQGTQPYQIVVSERALVSKEGDLAWLCMVTYEHAAYQWSAGEAVRKPHIQLFDEAQIK